MRPGVLDPEGAHLAALVRLGDFRGRRVLELGCGDGRLTAGIAHDADHVLAFDPDADAIERARGSCPAEIADRVEFRVASGVEIELPRHEFDLAVFSWSLWCVDPEDVVHVLHNLMDAVRPGGEVLDLQVIRPDATVERDGSVLCAVEGEPLLRKADAARVAIDALVRSGVLVDVGLDDHDVFKHYESSGDLVADFAESIRSLPSGLVSDLEALSAPVVVREHCRLRKLLVGARQVP